MRTLIARLWSEEQAATAVEYAVMLGLILMVIFASVALLGQNTQTVWSNNAAKIQAASSGS